VKLFFFLSHKEMKWDEAEKSSLFQLSPSFLSAIHNEVVGEAVLPNNFSKTTQLFMKLFLKK